MDEDLENLLRNIVFTIVIIIIFSIPFILFLRNKFGIITSNIEKNIENHQTFIILVKKDKCSNCKALEEVIKKENIPYQILNTSTQKNYLTILKKINLVENDIIEPSIIYVVEGNVHSILTSAKKKNLEEFITNIKTETE